MTTQTLTLTDFLLARIAEDEKVARRAGERMEHLPPGQIGGVGNLGIVGYPFARVLAECEAKRRIVEMHGSADPKWEGDCPWCGVRGPCLTMRALALPYADHPDYREEWRP